MAYNFDRELEALCQCRHPHVLEILGRAQTGGEGVKETRAVPGASSTGLRFFSWGWFSLFHGGCCWETLFFFTCLILLCFSG